MLATGGLVVFPGLVKNLQRTDYDRLASLCFCYAVLAGKEEAMVQYFLVDGARAVLHAVACHGT